MKNEAEGTGRVRYYIDSKSVWGQGAVMLMLIAVVFRIIGCWGDVERGVLCMDADSSAHCVQCPLRAVRLPVR